MENGLDKHVMIPWSLASLSWIRTESSPCAAPALDSCTLSLKIPSVLMAELLRTCTAQKDPCMSQAWPAPHFSDHVPRSFRARGRDQGEELY